MIQTRLDFDFENLEKNKDKCPYEFGLAIYGEYFYCETIGSFLTTIHDCLEICGKDGKKIIWNHSWNEKIEFKSEPRRYMGPKWARVPRGSIVELIAVVKGKIGVFRYNGEIMWCPVRLLHRIK